MKSYIFDTACELQQEKHAAKACESIYSVYPRNNTKSNMQSSVV